MLRRHMLLMCFALPLGKLGKDLADTRLCCNQDKIINKIASMLISDCILKEKHYYQYTMLFPKSRHYCVNTVVVTMLINFAARFLVGRTVDESCNDIRELLGLPLIQSSKDVTKADSEQAEVMSNVDRATAKKATDENTEILTENNRETATSKTASNIKLQIMYEADNETLTMLNGIAKVIMGCSCTLY